MDAGPLTYVCAHPRDIDARWVYADWLEERGEDGRAAFVRCQLKIHELQRCGPVSGSPRELLLEKERAAAEERELRAYAESLFAPQLWFEPPWGGEVENMCGFAASYYRRGAGSPVRSCTAMWKWGCLHTLTVDPSTGLQRLAAVVAEHPVCRLDTGSSPLPDLLNRARSAAGLPRMDFDVDNVW